MLTALSETNCTLSGSFTEIVLLIYFSGNMEVVMSTLLSKTNCSLRGSFTEIVLLFR